MRWLLAPDGSPGRAGGALDDAALLAAYACPADRPWLRALMLQTADGSAAGGDGRSGSVSGPGDRQVLRAVRANADAVLVGAGTARAEGYRPTAVPIALVSRSLDLDLGGALFADPVHRTLVITCATSDPVRRAEVARAADLVVAGDADVDLAAAVADLRERGLRRVDCEGGPSLLAAVAAAGLLDEVCLTTAPLLVAGDSSRITRGPRLPVPLPLRLTQVLEEDGFLFARYRVEAVAAG
jgi:riboflavin biosynthesis pyrimidine reductase